jgi:hypothetical protein
MRGKFMAVAARIAHRIPAGWYPDRYDRSRRRWWDGVEWTGHYTPVLESSSPESLLRIVDTAPTFEIEAVIDVEPAAPIEQAAMRSRVRRASNPEVHTTTRTLRGALRFKDRTPAFILVGLSVINLVLLALLLRAL